MNYKNKGMDNNRELQLYNSVDIPPSPYVRYIEQQPEKEVHLRDYLDVILKRKRLVIVFLISVIITTALFTYTMVPEYQSKAVIKIGEAPNVLSSIKGVTDSGQDAFETQLEIFKSRRLAQMVIKKLDLDKNKDFFPPETSISKIQSAITQPIKDALSGIISFFEPKTDRNRGADKEDLKDDYPPYLINSVIGGLDATAVKKSQLIEVSFESHNPELAWKIANTAAEAYIDYNLGSRVDASRDARIFLAKQIEDMKKKLEESENKLNAYASSRGIVFLDSNSSQSVSTKNLSDITSALNAATALRVQKEAAYRDAKEAGIESPVIANSPYIVDLRKKQTELETKYADLSRNYTPDYPEIRRLKDQLETNKSIIQQEASRLIKSAESDYRAAIRQEQNLKREYAYVQDEALGFQEKNTEFQMLKREVEVNQGLYNNLLQRLNEVAVVAMSKATNIQIVDRAVYPQQPFKPNKRLNFILSIVFGLIGGIGLAFTVEYFDNITVKDTQEIEKGMQIPTLGMIPLEDRLNGESRIRIVHSDISNPISEAFRSISTIIYLSSSSRPPKSILVTSPGEKEGKTTSCINIASALAESLGKGIIVDADLRKPRLHDSFELNNEIGLSTYLSGGVEFGGMDGRLIRPTALKGLHIMSAGPVPTNPTELLFSDRMKDLLDALHTMYNFAIFDAPPLLGMSDSVFLSTIVDGTVLVVKAGETPRSVIEESKRILKSVHAKLLGVVLNGVKKDTLRYGYYSSYSSSYFKE